MVNKTFKIIDQAGLHARPAAALAKEASKYASDIQMQFNGKKANMKSIMNILASGVTAGTEITVEASGDDEAAALEGIEKVLLADKVI